MSAERSEPRWVARAAVRAIHADQVREHGGSLGVRDAGLLESALERPRNRWHYDPDADLAALTAAYGVGIAKNHAFIDGNKRTAFQVMYVFVGLNGSAVKAEEPSVVDIMTGVAEGAMDEEALAHWIREHLAPRS